MSDDRYVRVPSLTSQLASPRSCNPIYLFVNPINIRYNWIKRSAVEGQGGTGKNNIIYHVLVSLYLPVLFLF